MATLQTQQEERRDRARRALDEYRIMCNINSSLLRLMENCDSRALSVTQQLGEMRSSNAARSSLEESVCRLDELATKLRSNSMALGDALDNVTLLVGRAGQINADAGAVLSRRYLVAGRKPTLEEIAYAMDYSADRVRQLHLVGLDIVCGLIDA